MDLVFFLVTLSELVCMTALPNWISSNHFGCITPTIPSPKDAMLRQAVSMKKIPMKKQTARPPYILCTIFSKTRKIKHMSNLLGNCGAEPILLLSPCGGKM